MSTEETLLCLGNVDDSFISDARKAGKEITIPQSAWCREHGFRSEKEFKAEAAKKGVIMYHAHYCFPSNEKMVEQMIRMDRLLKNNGLKLHRFGVSLNPSMAFPPEMRNDPVENNGLYLPDQKEWDELARFSFSQPHLGDNMIGSPASFDSCCKALRAGITTMGNMSQFFGWDYPEYPDVEKRAQSTVKAIAVMSEHVEDGAMIHSNLDDGYGDKCGDMAQLIAMAMLEKYIVEDIMGAKVAHSFGDMFHSPYKRLVFLSALKKIHGDQIFGSMVFSNKLGREKTELSWNDAHLCMCMLYDMAGQVHYKTGHAVTVMADRGLDDKVTNEELVRKLALAKQLEAYLPEVEKTIDWVGIDAKADELVARGTLLKDRALEKLSAYIDIHNAYAVVLAIKKIGVSALMDLAAEGLEQQMVLETDTGLYSH